MQNPSSLSCRCIITCSTYVHVHCWCVILFVKPRGINKSVRRKINYPHKEIIVLQKRSWKQCKGSWYWADCSITWNFFIVSFSIKSTQSVTRISIIIFPKWTLTARSSRNWKRVTLEFHYAQWDFVVSKCISISRSDYFRDYAENHKFLSKSNNGNILLESNYNEANDYPDIDFVWQFTG